MMTQGAFWGLGDGEGCIQLKKSIIAFIIFRRFLWQLRQFHQQTHLKHWFQR